IHYRNTGIFRQTSIRGNTNLTECPKAPPARREGSPRQFFSPNKKSVEKRENRPICNAANRSILRMRFFILFNTALRLLCAGGVRVLAAEQ
ncbi:hypothetical protein, partial [Millionella massiliensis]|uniref:hypothetical protein n=1 Tax=Millionella massiliensis TaxID=1871023 RepID=UPI0023A7A78B